MILKINGLPVTSKYEQIHQIVQENSYNSIGEAISDKISQAIHNTEWYRENSVFNVFSNYEGVRNLCDDDAICWMDAVNRSVMESTEITGMIYKFIQHRAGLIRDGFTENFFNNLDAALDFISWFF